MSDPSSTRSAHDKPRDEPQQWLAEHGDALFAYAITRVGDRHTAEDLVQEALLAALLANDRFRRQASTRTWLIGILRHKIVDHFRRANRTSPLNDEQLDKQIHDQEFNRRGHWNSTVARWSVDPAVTLQNREFWQAFDNCRLQLPPVLAMTFIMREFDQLDTESICDMLKISASNLSVRLYRARALLRRCLENHWFGGTKADDQ